MKVYGSVPRKRKTAIKKHLGYDCKCPVCLGQVPVQEKILKKLIELHSKLNPKPSDFKREAGLRSRIVDLTLELNIGHPNEKSKALTSLAAFAHLARDKDLVRKAKDMLKKFAEENKIGTSQGLEEVFAEWSEFNSNNKPDKKEIDFFLISMGYF